MNARLLAAIRILRRVLALLAALLVVLVLAASLATYAAVSGKSLRLLRGITTRVGQLMAGQRTDHLALDVRVTPAEGRMSGTASLTVRSLEEGRRRFYFLLNDGLKIRNASVGPQRQPATAYQLWLLTIIDVGSPVPKDGTLQLSLDYEGRPDTGLFSIGSNRIDAHAVLLNVDSFWYPSDVQGFFTADVSVTLPRAMHLVYNASNAVISERGDAQQIHWTSERPLAGLSLVAGPYAMKAKDIDGVRYVVHLPPDVQLDADRILSAMAVANRTLSARYGPSQFPQLTVFVSRELRRAFNDGAGVMGVSIRYFRAGDYGFGVLAHEIAHTWWGDMVAEKWLSPGTGGEWIVEGFAEFSSLVAAEAAYGPDALTRRLAEEFFDPAHTGALASMSVLDNAIAEPIARDTIYRKGAYVAHMLRRVIGDDAYFRGLRQFLERYRFQPATDRDLQQVLQENTDQDLERYFADWVRSDVLADLSLDGTDQTGVTVGNLGSAAVPGTIDLWTVKKNGGEPVRASVHVGDRVTLEPDTDYAILDPLLAWADVQRENNRYPRRHDPGDLAVSATGTVAVTEGEAVAWARTSIASTDNNGRTLHTWEFTRGMTAPARWSPDGAFVVANYSDLQAAEPAVVTLATDGLQHTVGYASAPAPGTHAVIYAADHDRVIRFASNGEVSTVVRRRGESLDQPLPSPDGTRLAYIATRDNHVELRSVGTDGHDDRPIVAWDRDRIRYQWSPDARHLYAIMGGEWDWQIWDIPIDSGPVTVLVSEAAAIDDLALSADGRQLAFTAAPALDYPRNRRQLFVLDLGDRSVRTVDIPDADLTRLAWRGPDSILVIASDADPARPWMLPARRVLKSARPSDSSITDFP